MSVTRSMRILLRFALCGKDKSMCVYVILLY